MKVSKVYFMVMATDVARAVRFYHDAFDLKVAFESPEWSELRFGEATIGVHGRAETPASDVETGLGFELDDIDAGCQAVERAGGRIVSPPTERPGEGIRLATAADPEGNRFSLAQSTGWA
jgi:predicted enzyme related to lactoylglutathione lyase